MSSLAGRRVIVTGTASGIGEATASLLVTAGAEVVSIDRHPPTVAVSEHHRVDLADPSSIDTVVGSLNGQFDALINVAGVPGTAAAETVFAVNTLAVRHLSEALLEQLAGGSIVIVGSSAGFGWPKRLDLIKDMLSTETFADGLEWFRSHQPEGNAYNFSKEVVTVYAQMMGLGLSELGVRINAALPGPVQTPILVDFEETMGKETLDGVKDLIGRHGLPGDIARVLVFLASPESAWINGQAIAVDGGVSGALATGLFPEPEI